MRTSKDARVVLSAVVTIVAVCLLSLSTANAGVITYDFNDGTLGGLLVTGRSPGYSYNVSAGRLHVTAATDSNGVGGASLQLATPFNVTGDFTVTVDASFPNPPSGEELDLSMYRPGIAGYANLYLYHGGVIWSGIALGSSPQTFNSVQTGITSATFKLSRTGDTIATSYNTGSGFVALGQVTDPANTYPMPIHIGLYQEHAGAVTAAGSFDNLTITSPSVPEPASLSLLAFGGVSLFRRRRARRI